MKENLGIQSPSIQIGALVGAGSVQPNMINIPTPQDACSFLSDEMWPRIE
jgi:hypothetical protein